MSSAKTHAAPNPTLKAYEDKVTAQMQQAKARLQQFEAAAKEKGAQGATVAINSVKAAKQNIERKLQDLKTTHDSHVAPAKADIDADIAKLKASIDELAAKFKN